MNQRESSLEHALVDYAKKHNIYTRKFVSPSNRGVPDRLFVYGGVVLFIEFKQKGKKPTPLQSAELHKLRGQCACACWCDDKELGMRLLNQMTLDPNDFFLHLNNVADNTLHLCR